MLGVVVVLEQKQPEKVYTVFTGLEKIVKDGWIIQLPTYNYNGYYAIAVKGEKTVTGHANVSLYGAFLDLVMKINIAPN